MKDNKILFYPASDFAAKHIDPPATASSSNIPDWYRDLPKYINNDKSFKKYENTNNLTVKSCLPVVDSFTMGYTIQLYCDVQVTRPNGNIQFDWNFATNEIQPPVTVRPENDQKVGWKNIYGYEELSFNWMPQWSIKTPKGYSSFFVHPLNRPDLPFYTLDGVIDTDSWGVAGNHPFLLKKDWEGIIPVGTPIIQIIPFKREPWFSEVDKNISDESTKKYFLRNRYLKDFYKKKCWNSKTFK
jgi:hypothetical protein